MSKESVMIVGEGSREQALAWSLSRSPYVAEVLIAPGNAGSDHLSQQMGKLIRNTDIPGGNVTGIIDLARKHGVSLVVVGPETWLEREVGDELREAKILAVAPPKDQAMLELSKVETRLNCAHWNVPQPKFNFFTKPQDAIDSVPQEVSKLVVKVDGLAGGKGVTVCDTHEEIIAAINSAQEKFGHAADAIILEERLYGTEVSYIVLTDGTSFIRLPPARDHKRRDEGDLGPNTGGMGVIAPNPAVTPEIAAEIEEKIIKPILAGMRNKGIPYQGVLYAGVMLTSDGPKLLELNCRFGAPETEAQLPLFPYDLYEILTMVARGKLPKDADSYRRHTQRVPKASCVVILAANGYPEKPRTGDAITGLANAHDIAQQNGGLIFYAGAKKLGEQIVTSGGRVLAATGLGNSPETARINAYEIAGEIYFDGRQYRKDIGE